jgi:hypothetical protein
MTLTNPIKVLVGVTTLLVVLLPFGLLLLWGLMVIPTSMAGPSSDYPFQVFDMVFALAFPMMCLFNILIYALMAFYVTHAIKNQGASDFVRIVALLAVFLLPYLGMPFYYIVYILMPQPPTWALKPQPANP